MMSTNQQQQDAPIVFAEAVPAVDASYYTGGNTSSSSFVSVSSTGVMSTAVAATAPAEAVMVSTVSDHSNNSYNMNMNNDSSHHSYSSSFDHHYHDQVPPMSPIAATNARTSSITSRSSYTGAAQMLAPESIPIVPVSPIPAAMNSFTAPPPSYNPGYHNPNASTSAGSSSYIGVGATDNVTSIPSTAVYSTSTATNTSDSGGGVTCITNATPSYHSSLLTANRDSARMTPYINSNDHNGSPSGSTTTSMMATNRNMIGLQPRPGARMTPYV